MINPLWSPSEKFKQESRLAHYISWLGNHKALLFQGYQELWDWSTNHLPEFWKSLVEYFEVTYDGTIDLVVSSDPMPFAQWFTGIKLNYAEHIFKNETKDRPCIIYSSETDPIQSLSWEEVKKQVGSIQHLLKESGIKTGDRIAAYVPCIPEATIAFLATNALGAVWSSCSPDFGTGSVLDRFVQIEPKVLIATDTYQYNGKRYHKTQELKKIIQAIPSLEMIILIGDSKENLSTSITCLSWKEAITYDGDLSFTRVPFDHPMWVLYSSGTTGLPKAITHSQGGILMEQYKYGAFHNNFKAGDRCFWYTTTGWMMWNYLQGSLLAGGVMVLYDGSPAYPTLTRLWELIEKTKINHFGTSAGFILANLKNDINPKSKYDLSSLVSLGSTGSTLPPEGFRWVYTQVKNDLWLHSMSGGTDVCSAFVGGNPLWPVYEGEIQCRALGCKLQAFSEIGMPVENEVGEMVITKPMPSMPIYFWKDPDKKRYLESYFNLYPGVWRHGDWVEITSHLGLIIYGRSDATLNRGGIRIGTSEIYRSVDKLEEIKDSLIICLEQKEGQFWMPLFVVLKKNGNLNAELIQKVKNTIKDDHSPRHIPDEIIAVPDIPYTLSGKKTEMPVKKILLGADPEKVINKGALKNPESMNFFIQLAHDRQL